MDFQQLKQFILTLNHTNILIFTLLSVLLCFFWLILCLMLDRRAPEPKKQILRAFLWGGFLVFPVLFLTGPLNYLFGRPNTFNSVLQILVLSFLIDGFIEEWAKYLILLIKVYPSKYFDEPRDGVIYGMILGLGFSFVENFLYSLTFAGLGMGITLIIFRGLLTTAMHLLSGGIIGYYLGLTKFMPQKSKKIMWVGLILAILFHGFYNTIIRFGYDWTIIPLALLLIVTYVFIVGHLRSMRRSIQKEWQK